MGDGPVLDSSLQGASTQWKARNEFIETDDFVLWRASRRSLVLAKNFLDHCAHVLFRQRLALGELPGADLPGKTPETFHLAHAGSVLRNAVAVPASAWAVNSAENRAVLSCPNLDGPFHFRRGERGRFFCRNCVAPPKSLVFSNEIGSRGRTRTYNHTVNSRVLYH